jgi:hypothetical protein
MESQAIPTIQHVPGWTLRQATAIFPQTVEQFLRGRQLRHLQRLPAQDMDFDVIAFLQPQRVNDRGREAHCQTISPARDLHGTSLIDEMVGIYLRGQIADPQDF